MPLVIVGSPSTLTAAAREMATATGAGRWAASLDSMRRSAPRARPAPSGGSSERGRLVDQDRGEDGVDVLAREPFQSPAGTRRGCSRASRCRRGRRRRGSRACFGRHVAGVPSELAGGSGHQDATALQARPKSRTLTWISVAAGARRCARLDRGGRCRGAGPLSASHAEPTARVSARVRGRAPARARLAVEPSIAGTTGRARRCRGRRSGRCRGGSARPGAGLAREAGLRRRALPAQHLGATAPGLEIAARRISPMPPVRRSSTRKRPATTVPRSIAMAATHRGGGRAGRADRHGHCPTAAIERPPRAETGPG